MGRLTLVTCYKAGTFAVMESWLASVRRHEEGLLGDIVILTKKGDVDEGLRGLVDRYAPVEVEEVEVGDDPLSMSRIHGIMLDSYVPGRIKTELVVTMDSDCFPVANGWASELAGMLDSGARLAGILHPWGPPPKDMKKTKLEWRVRSQHCWERTHVACQMVRTDDLKELGVKFSKGDDTGLLVTRLAAERGWKTAGYMPTRCPRPAIGKVSPEFNRYVGLVYGDKVFHLGGFTRVSVCGDAPVFEEDFGWARDRMLRDKGAEFLLDDEQSYRFKFDREEEVAAEKMQRLFGMANQRMGL
jgi:hypothetical protein